LVGSTPEFVFDKFCQVLKYHLAADLILNSIWVRGWGKMALSRARRVLSAGLEKGMLNWVG